MTTPNRELELARDLYVRVSNRGPAQAVQTLTQELANYRAEIERKAAEEMRERAAQICVNGPHRTPPVCLTICHHVDAAAIRGLSHADMGEHGSDQPK